MDSVTARASSIHFALGGGSFAFTGRLDGDRLTGTLKSDSGAGTFALTRAAPPHLPYLQENVTFHNGSVMLAGSVYVPDTLARHPAVVLLHGSGPQTRWGTMRFIADRLARRGIASIIYDKRGSGDSGGDWRTATYIDLADDAIAAIGVLKLRRDIDPAKIGIWGHSQGGMIAPAVATRSASIAFVVDADGPIGPQYEQDLYRVRNALDQSTFTKRERADAFALYRQFVDVARTGTGHSKLDAAIARSSSKPWFDWLALPPKDNWLWKWYRSAGNFDAATYWRNVKVPVLIVFGERDRLVPPDNSIAQTEAILRRNKDVAVDAILLPAATHELHIEPEPNEAFFWWRMVPGYPDFVIDWIRRTSGSS